MNENPLEKPGNTRALETEKKAKVDPLPRTAGRALRLVPAVMDGATARVPRLPPELEDDRRRARDGSCPLADRVEAFENLTGFEVGQTALIRARNVERETGTRQIFLKFEGGNPTGSQKDRIAFAHVLDALRRGYGTITLATCGNYGAAAAFAASLAGLRCLVFIPATYHPRRIDEMERHGAEIVRSPGDYEMAVLLSRNRAAEDDDVYDANPGSTNASIQLDAYAHIADEIVEELRDAPAAVAVPVSNGTTLAGLHHGFLRLYRSGRTSRMPRMLAGSSFRNNPIVRAVLEGAERCEDLPAESIRESAINEPLINWHSFDGDRALAAIRRTEGGASQASDRRLRVLSTLIRRREGLHVLPASTAALHALLDANERYPLPGDRYVVVLTGRRE